MNGPLLATVRKFYLIACEANCDLFCFSACNPHCHLLPRREPVIRLGMCGRGGTGRRAALRSLWVNIPWKFESSRPHQISLSLPGVRTSDGIVVPVKMITEEVGCYLSVVK